VTDSLARLNATIADRYRLERELGAGGMATVYLALDVRHDRKVALKVLRPELAAVIGAERFLKEIKVTANLQHPHILGLIDSGEADGLLFYVMPFVPGESLRERLAREKQLPVDEAVRIAREVASALDYAHRHHVIHRDIKPENILLHDGAALVADFGIALAVSTAGGTRMTETGMSLGTPHYMSPEQAMGEREITARSDVYALGAVLYEMLSGEPPFTGPTAQAVVARVMTDAPRPLIPQRHTIAPHVEAAVLTALEKLPADRFATAAGFADALANPAATAAAPAMRSAIRAPRSRSRSMVLVVAALALLGAGALLGRLTVGRPASPAVARFSIPLGQGSHLTDGPQVHVALSPDGTTLVYGATPGGSANQLYARSLGALAATPIPGTQNAASPFFSPDGRWLAFHADNQIKRLSVAGGAPVAIAPAPGGRDGTWTDDGRIVFSGAGGALWTVPAEGGTPVIAVAPDSAAHEREIMLPDALPGGRTVVATVVRSASLGGTDLVRIDLESGARTVIVPRRAAQGRYLAGGHLVYALDDGTLLAVPFDPRTGRTTGSPITVLENVRINFSRTAQFAVSRSGALAYANDEPAQIGLVDRRGASTPLPTQGAFHHLRFSPDGRRLVMDIAQPSGRDVWVRDLAQGTLTRVSFEGDANDPVWTPDGRRVCYGTARAGVRGVWCRRAAGGAEAESVYVGPQETTAGVFTPDGQELILIQATPTGYQLLVHPTAGGQPATLLSSPFELAWPALSPDGRWLAYVSSESGRYQVYVRPLKGEGDRVQVSADGGTEPVWSRDGRELYYVTEQNGVMAVGVAATGSEFRTLGRTLLFTLPEMQTAAPHANYDVDAAGRFAMVLRPAAGAVVMVLNWRTELDRAGRTP
jgi:serine/threonine-protein kinase